MVNSRVVVCVVALFLGGLPAAAQEKSGSSEKPSLAWTAPASWKQGPEKMLRSVTYYPDGDKQSECSVTILPGTAGGTRANVNRWLAQLGRPEMTDEQVENLPALKILGEYAPFVSASGTPQGKSAPQGLLGAVCHLDNHTVFVKLTGPKARVEAERDRFLAFCRSLREASGKKPEDPNTPEHADGKRKHSIRGTVRDEGGSPVADAIVTAKDRSSGKESRARTGADGTFVLESLKGSDYSLAIERDGRVVRIESAKPGGPGIAVVLAGPRSEAPKKTDAVAPDQWFPKSGERFEVLNQLPVDKRLRDTYAESGVFTLESPAKKLTIVDWNGTALVQQEFLAVFPISKTLISAALPDRTWVLIDIPRRRMLGPWKASRSFSVQEPGHIIHTISNDEAVLCVLEGAKLKRVSPVYRSIYPASGASYFAADKSGRWGLVGVDGKVRIPFVYEEIQTIGDYLRVTLAKPDGITDKHPLARRNRTGLLTLDGREVLPCVYDEVGDPVNDVCAWKKPGDVGATNLKTGKILLKQPTGGLKYDVRNVDGTSFIVGHKSSPLARHVFSSWRVYHVAHGYLSKEDYYNIEPVPTPKGPLYLVQKSKPIVNKPVEIRDARFRVVGTKVFKVLPSRPGLLVATNESGSCLLDFNGKLVVDSARLAGVPTSKDGSFFERVRVRAQGKFGFADLSGNDVIPATYTRATFFNSYGIAAVKTDKAWGVIDKDGKWVVEPTLLIVHLYPQFPFILAAPSNEKISLYDVSGEEILSAPFRFRYDVIAQDRLAVTEYKDAASANQRGAKPVRRFLVALK